MASFTSKILNNATSALSATQALIAATGNNIANVNTPGYVRRTVQLETRSASSSSVGANIGNGVDVGSITRVADKFLEAVLKDATSGKESAVIQKDFLERLNGMFSLTGDQGGIGTRLGEFFSALNDIGTNPSSIELRQNVIEKGRELVASIQSTYGSLASLQREADTRIANEVQTVNTLTAQIAELNVLVSQREADGISEASDERDARDLLLKQLAEKISFTSLEEPNGSVTISLANGFPLVLGGTSRSLSVTTSPSFAPGGSAALDEQRLSYIVYDYDSGPGQADLDLTGVMKAGEGTIGGLLKVRGTNSSATDPFAADGAIVEVAARLEGMARSLLTDFNSVYLGPDYDGGTAGHQPSSGDLDGNPPDVFGFFDFDYGGAKDADADGLPSGGDITAALTALNRGSIIGLLNVNSDLDDPRRFAAAQAVSAPPDAPTFAPGDGRTAAALANLQFDRTTTFSAGPGYSFTGTYEEAFQETITLVGNRAARARSSASVAESNFISASNRRDEVSGVSLDEEFTNLIKYQKAFEASARMIRVADEILQQIVALI